MRLPKRVLRRLESGWLVLEIEIEILCIVVIAASSIDQVLWNCRWADERSLELEGCISQNPLQMNRYGDNLRWYSDMARNIEMCLMLHCV